MAEEIEWTTVTRKGKSAMEIEETIQTGEQQKKGTPKRKETSNASTGQSMTLEQRKRFQPTPYQATQATQPIEEKDFQSAADLIKQRGAIAIDLATEVVTPMTIKFIVPPLAKVFHLRNAFVRLYQKLAEKDATLKVSVSSSNAKWDQTDLPNGTEFKELITATYKKSA
eukprot:8464767-Ditylum_brightwellii.AAC.1